MAAGLVDHVWSLEEIVMMVDNYLPKPAKRGLYNKKISNVEPEESCVHPMLSHTLLPRSFSSFSA
jgi:hypothetical protein